MLAENKEILFLNPIFYLTIKKYKIKYFIFESHNLVVLGSSPL